MQALIAIIQEILQPVEINDMILNQINKFHSTGYSYTQIGRSIYYWFSVRKNDKNSVQIYGIGFVPKVVNDAEKYVMEQRAIKAKRESDTQIAIHELSQQRPIKIVTPMLRKKNREDVE